MLIFRYLHVPMGAPEAAVRIVHRRCRLVTSEVSTDYRDTTDLICTYRDNEDDADDEERYCYRIKGGLVTGMILNSPRFRLFEVLRRTKVRALLRGYAAGRRWRKVLDNGWGFTWNADGLTYRANYSYACDIVSFTAYGLERI